MNQQPNNAQRAAALLKRWEIDDASKRAELTSEFGLACENELRIAAQQSMDEEYDNFDYYVLMVRRGLVKRLVQELRTCKFSPEIQACVDAWCDAAEIDGVQ